MGATVCQCPDRGSCPQRRCIRRRRALLALGGNKKPQFHDPDSRDLTRRPVVITLLKPLDITSRLHELCSLRDGWLNGEGRAPNAAGLNWLTGSFNQHFPSDVALPYLYPTPAGGIQAEWSLSPHEITLEINLEDHHGEWRHLNLETNEDNTCTLAMDEPAVWEWIINSIRMLRGGVV